MWYRLIDRVLLPKCPTSRTNNMYFDTCCAERIKVFLYGLANVLAYVPHIKIKLHAFGDRLYRTEESILVCGFVRLMDYCTC